MGNVLRQWWGVVLGVLGESLTQTLGDLPPISDDEIDQLGRDRWWLCSDIDRQSLLPCPPLQTRGGCRLVDACRGGNA